METRPPTPRETPPPTRHATRTRPTSSDTYPTIAQLPVPQAIRRRLEMTRRGQLGTTRRGPQGTTRLTRAVIKKKRRVINSIKRVGRSQDTDAGREIEGSGAPQDSKPPHDARFGEHVIARWGGSRFSGRYGTRAAQGEEVEPPKPRRPPPMK